MISVDSNHARDLLRYNQSRTKVLTTPVFVLRSSSQTAPTLYPISVADQLFESIRPQLGTPTKEEEPVRDSTMITVNWNLNSSPETLEISPGDGVRFISTDGILHDVTLADSNWNPIRRLIPRQVGMHSDLTFDQSAHLICSIPNQSEKMRLKLKVADRVRRMVIEDSTDQILDGLSRKREPKKEVIVEEQEKPEVHEEEEKRLPVKKLTYAQKKIFSARAEKNLKEASLHTE